MKKSKSKGRDLRVHRQSTFRRSQRSIRSGYAFAHQAGFGELITSGLNMKERAMEIVTTPVRLTKMLRHSAVNACKKSPSQEMNPGPGSAGDGEGSHEPTPSGFKEEPGVRESQKSTSHSTSSVDSSSQPEPSSVQPQGKIVFVERLW